MRRSTLALGLIGGATLLLSAEILHAQLTRHRAEKRMRASADLVRGAGLTDLALFTEARYSRHPALADLHAAFQDSPMSFEHFPSGSFAPRPATGWGRGTLGFDKAEVQR